MIKRFSILLLIVCAACASTPQVDVKGRVVRRDHSYEDGRIEYDRGARRYTVWTSLGLTIRIPADDVMAVRCEQPKDFELAHTRFALDAYSDAIPAFKKVMRQYHMLYWDVMSANYLTICYARLGRFAAAIENYEANVKGKGKRMSQAYLAYLEALMETDSARFKREMQKIGELSTIDQKRVRDMIQRKKNR